MNAVYISRWSAWAPGIETSEDWKQWNAGALALRDDASPPGLSFAPTMFKRRLSQLSRMVIQTGHEVLGENTGLKITFSSIYGEIVQQMRISQKLLESGDVSPAHFSLSVFNAPVAAASIVEKNTAGYSALFSGSESFEIGLEETAAALLAGVEQERIFIYGDESLPPEYQLLAKGPHWPFCIALRLSREPTPGSILLPDLKSLFGKSFTQEAIRENLTPGLLFFKKHLLTPCP